jgi:amino acid adenylation domain-containing protein
VSRDIRDIYPLTSMQQGMLVESLAAAGAPVYLQHYDLELTGVPDADLLRAGLADLVARHDVLRTGFVWDVGDQPLQVVRATAEVPLTVTDLRDQADDVESRVADVLAQERTTPFDLRAAPLLRARALRVGDDRWRLVTTHHHLVLDGWSVPILHAELVEFLTARHAGRRATLPPPVRFREFVTWQRSHADDDAERRYFADLLGDVDRPTPIGADLPVLGADRDSADHTRRVTVLRPVKQEDHPDRVARAAGVLPSTVVHAAWALLLGRWADVDTVVFGTTVSGRPAELAGAAGRVGMFVNTAPIRVDLPDTTVGAWLAHVRDRLDAARPHEQAPVPTAQRHSGIPVGQALLSSVLAFQNYWRREQDSLGAGDVTVAVRQRTERVDLPVAVAVALPEDGVWVRLDYDGTLVEAAEAERIAERLAHLITVLAALPPQTPLAEVPLQDTAPADLVVRRASVTRLDAGGVLRAVDGAAEVAALASAAQATADALRGAGVGEGDRVGVCLPVGLGTGTAVLAVLRLGAHVVPVDPYLAPAELTGVPAARGLVALLVEDPAAVLLDPGVPVVSVGSAVDGTDTLAYQGSHAFTAGVRLLAQRLGLDSTDLVSVVLAPDDPALPSVLVAALGAGATVELAEPHDPEHVAGATVLVARSTAAAGLAPTSAPGARVVLVAEPPTPGLVTDLLAVGRRPVRVLAGERTGVVHACVELTAADSGLALGCVADALVLDRSGRPAGADVPGELAVSNVDGLNGVVALGVRVRSGDGGLLTQLGHGPADDLAHAEHLICADASVAAAVLVPGRDGLRAWVVPAVAELDTEALDRRLRDRLPARLRPVGYHLVPALPVAPYGAVDRAALDTFRPPAAALATALTPVADRLAALSHGDRDAFLQRLRSVAARTPGLRAAARDDNPSSAQQQQWRALASTALRSLAELPLPAGVDATTVPDLVARHGLPAHALRVEDACVLVDPAELDVTAALVLLTGAAATGAAVSAADYAAWQTGQDQAARRDEQLAHWRTALAGLGALGLPPDRTDDGEPTTTTLALPDVVAEPGAWLAAVAVAVSVLAGADDLTLGVVDRPALPAELDGVPGPFARMLPVRVTLAADTGFGALASSVAAALDAARRNGDVAWSDLAALLPEPPSVSVAVHGSPGVLAAHAGALFALDIAPDDAGSGSTLTVLSAPGRSHPVTAARLAALVEQALRVGTAAPDRVPSAADLLTPEHRDTLLRRGDGGPGVPASQPTLPAWIREVAARRPTATAVLATDGELDYAGLVATADTLSARLAALGVGVEDRVGVCLPRGLATVWAPLGVMGSGAAYVPLDPLYPDERLRVVCADADLAAVVTTADLAGRFADRPTVLVDTLASTEQATAPDPVLGAHNAAYLIYTSGSTGTPKGVVVEHGAITDFCRHIADAYGIDTSTRLLGFASLTFDVSAFDLWAALTTGATLVLAGDEERASVESLQRLLVDRRVTMAELPPSLMPLLDPASLPDLVLVSVGGEAPAGALVDTWATAERRFFNGYGPTETTVAVTLMRCEPPSQGQVPPIGLPMVGHRAYVLDTDLRLVPDGVPGELCVAGPGLARGYLGRPAATAERFAPDPYSDVPGARLYRTGDLVRWTPAGVLEFLGRIDRQVKIRGFRVELGDVEAALAGDPDVRQVVVRPWDDPNGTRHLVAYVVATHPEKAPTLASVRDAAGLVLPAYMVPTRVVVLDRLPLARNGKIDRAALPEPVAEHQDGVVASTRDWTPTERVLADEVIAPLLGRSVVDRTEDFFQLGGNSLQATQVTARVRDRFAVEVSLLDFFAEPTVAHLADLVDAAAPAAEPEHVSPVVAMTAGARLPLSYPQRALYDAYLLDGDTVGYHAPFPLRFGGPLDLDALAATFAWLVRRHAPLRVRFVDDGDGPLQVVQDGTDVPLRIVDLPGADVEARADAVPDLIAQENRQPFDLAAGPLLRVTVYRLAPDDHVVVWNIHHIVTDGWSTGVQLHEIGTAYRAFAEGTRPDLPALGADYGEFVAWHRDYVASPSYQRDLAWWRDNLAGAPSSLGGSVASRADFVHGWRNLRLADDVATDVRELARRSNATLYMVLLAAYAVALAAEYGQDDLLVITPNALRVRSAWEGLIGWFVNRVVVRLRVRPDATFADLVEHARTASLEAFAHGNVPLEVLRAELGLSGDAIAAHLSVQNAPPGGGGGGFGGLRVDMVKDASGRDFAPIMEVYSPVGARFQVSGMVRERQDGTIAGGFEFDASRLPESRADEVHACLLAVLAAGAANPDTRVADLT